MRQRDFTENSLNGIDSCVAFCVNSGCFGVQLYVKLFMPEAKMIRVY